MSDQTELVISTDVGVWEVSSQAGAVSSSTAAVELLEVARQGPEGRPGDGGVFFLQSSPSALWVINHNLGYKPIIALMDSAGSEIIGNVIHISLNTANVYFNQAIAGAARYI